VKKTRLQRQANILSAYAISTLLGGGLIVGGFVALLIGLRLYGSVGLIPGAVLAGLGILVLNRRDRWSGHHP
jgi:hypothetical protein